MVVISTSTICIHPHPHTHKGRPFLLVLGLGAAGQVGGGDAELKAGRAVTKGNSHRAFDLQCNAMQYVCGGRGLVSVSVSVGGGGVRRGVRRWGEGWWVWRVKGGGHRGWRV